MANFPDDNPDTRYISDHSMVGRTAYDPAAVAAAAELPETLPMAGDERTALHDGPSREKDLHMFANRLTSLAKLLDTRTQTLHAAESKILTQRDDLQRQETALHATESRTREQLSELLNDLAHRQKALSARESHLRQAKKNMSPLLSSARVLLSSASDIAKQLPARQTELRETQLTLKRHNTALADAKVALAHAQRQREGVLKDTSNLMEDRRKLQRTTERLQQLDAAIQKRDEEVTRHEVQLASRETQLSKYACLQRVVTPLQHLLDELFAADGKPAPTISDDLVHGVETLVSRVSDARSEARTLAETKTSLSTKSLALEERARRLRLEESAVRERQDALLSEKRRVTALKQTSENLLAQAEASKRTAEELNVRIEAREDRLSPREASVFAAEEAIGRREKAVDALEHALRRKEQSISRAQITLTARETEAQRRLKDIEIDRKAVETMRKEVEVREGLLHNRELDRYQYASRMDEPAEIAADPAPLPERRESADPATVRRQLAFESSSKVQSKLPPQAAAETGMSTAPGQNGNAQPRTVNFHAVDTSASADASERPADIQHAQHVDEREDAESEDAAQQLLPELMSARSLWKERIVRLEDVVRNMREQSWTVRPHVQPVLISVADILRALRGEVETPPETPPGVECLSSRLMYSREQKCQVRWSTALREQLDAVRQVQTGILIGIRDPQTGPPDDRPRDLHADAALDVIDESGSSVFGAGVGQRFPFGGSENSESANTHTSLGRSSTAVTGEDVDGLPAYRGDSGSAEATLDATLDATTNVRLQDALDITLNVDDSSFMRLRQEIRAGGHEGQHSENPTMQFSNRRDETVHHELITLQNELKSIMGEHAVRSERSNSSNPS